MDEDTVDGMTIEAYARLAVELHRVPEPEWDAVASRFGVAPDAVTGLGERWQAKMAAEPSLALAYNDAYQRAMVEAGITAPDITLEQYADLLRTGGPSEANLKRYSISLQQFSMISHRWSTALGSDPGLAQRFAELMMRA